MKRYLIAAVLAVLAMGVQADASHETRTDTRLYTQAAGDQYILQCGSPDPDLGELGGACLSFEGDEESVKDIVIRDETGLPVGGYYQFTDAFGDTGSNLGSGVFCDRISALSIPEGAIGVGVWVDGPVYGPQDCLLSHTVPGIGIRGFIDVTYILVDPEE